MSITFSQAKPQADERKTILQIVQKQAKAAAWGFLEAEVNGKLGRVKGGPVRSVTLNVRLTGSVPAVDVPMPINLPAMGITDAIWRQAGTI